MTGSTAPKFSPNISPPFFPLIQNCEDSVHNVWPQGARTTSIVANKHAPSWKKQRELDCYLTGFPNFLLLHGMEKMFFWAPVCGPKTTAKTGLATVSRTCVNINVRRAEQVLAVLQNHRSPAVWETLQKQSI